MAIVASVLLLILLVSVFIGREKTAESTEAIVSDQYDLQIKNCWFAVPDDEEVFCGELLTPVASGQFRLPFVILRDTSPERRADPVIYLQGGPGAATRMDEEGIAYWTSWRRGANLHRDLVLVDIRGAGRSQPALACNEYDRFTLRALRENLTMEQELQQGLAVIQHCFVQLSSRGFKPEHYGTQVSASDLRALMQLLNQEYPDYERWNLLGVSYGSRLAMAAASGNPQVNALILDSAYPSGFGGTQSWPEVFDQAMRKFFLWCEQDADCNPNSRSDLMGLLQQTLQQLRDQPLQLSVRRWDGEAPVELVLNDHRFLSAVFFALYSPYDWVHLVPAMEDINRGGRNRLNGLIESFINNALSPDFNGLVFMAVDCRDHPMQSAEDYQQLLETYPQFASYMQHLWVHQACQLFPVGDGLHITPLPTQPGLILAGELDPITPLHWAESLHSQWLGSQLLRFADTGHGVINHHVCVYTRLGEFLDNPREKFGACRAEISEK